jgi:hypothetical protein
VPAGLQHHDMVFVLFQCFYSLLPFYINYFLLIDLCLARHRGSDLGALVSIGIVRCLH